MLREEEFTAAVGRLLAANLIEAEAASDRYGLTTGTGSDLAKHWKHGLFGWIDAIPPACAASASPQDTDWSLPTGVFQTAVDGYLARAAQRRNPVGQGDLAATQADQRECPPICAAAWFTRERSVSTPMWVICSQHTQERSAPPGSCRRLRRPHLVRGHRSVQHMLRIAETMMVCASGDAAAPIIRCPVTRQVCRSRQCVAISPASCAGRGRR